MYEKSIHNKQKSILIIEDDRFDYEHLNFYLQRCCVSDIKVYWAKTINDAQTFISSNIFDIIIFDFYIQDRSPYTLIKKLDPSCKTTKIMLISSAPKQQTQPFVDYFDDILVVDKAKATFDKVRDAFDTLGLHIVH